jgi:hypothetical protein
VAACAARVEEGLEDAGRLSVSGWNTKAKQRQNNIAAPRRQKERSPPLLRTTVAISAGSSPPPTLAFRSTMPSDLSSGNFSSAALTLFTYVCVKEK